MQKPTVPPRQSLPRIRGAATTLVLVALLVALLAAGGGAAGYSFFTQAQAETGEVADKGEGKRPGKAGKKKAPALYKSLDPAFVVNLADRKVMRFLQVEVEVMSRDPKVLAAMDTHMPVIRNQLILLFGSRSSRDIADRQGKEALQREALGEIRAVLAEAGAPDGVEDLFFTSLIVQ